MSQRPVPLKLIEILYALTSVLRVLREIATVVRFPTTYHWEFWTPASQSNFTWIYLFSLQLHFHLALQLHVALGILLFDSSITVQSSFCVWEVSVLFISPCLLQFKPLCCDVLVSLAHQCIVLCSDLFWFSLWCYRSSTSWGRRRKWQ